jgi:UDP:flavonoid glycosyltransferase YjiC (YdhE family)
VGDLVPVLSTLPVSRRATIRPRTSARARTARQASRPPDKASAVRDLQPSATGTQRRAGGAGRYAAEMRRERHGQGAANALHDSRALRVPAFGPGIWDPPVESPAWLEDLGKPIVLVTCSTEFQNDGKFAQTTLEALADEDVNVLVTTAGVDPSNFTTPPNARVVKFLPHAPGLERASCVVCHGGMCITQKALASGIPVCVVPFGRDQLEVARHVEVARAGTRLPATQLRPDRLRSAVRKAMSRRAGAELMDAAFARSGGPQAAADALDGLVRERWSGSVAQAVRPAIDESAGRRMPFHGNSLVSDPG